MNPMLSDTRRTIIFCIWFILIQATTAIAGDPQISIVVDKARTPPFQHGLLKLIDALKAKNISFEQVTQLRAAKGITVIVAGIGQGDNISSLELSKKNHEIPQT